MGGRDRMSSGVLGAGGDAATLIEFLQYMRDGVVRHAEGAGAAAARPGVASGTSLAWLVRHLTVSERFWFCGAVVDDWEAASRPPSHADIDELLAEYRVAAGEADAVIAGWTDDLERVVDAPANGRPPCTARWILQHMITETGRHAGHADILREQIDGTVGR